MRKGKENRLKKQYQMTNISRILYTKKKKSKDDGINIVKIK